MTENNNNNQYPTIGELSRRINNNDTEIKTIKDQITTIREGNVEQREILKTFQEDKRESKKTNEKIFDILDLFKTEFIEIKQEMINNKLFRVESTKKFVVIEDKVNAMETDVKELQNDPAKRALIANKNFKKVIIGIVTGVFSGVSVSLLVAILLHLIII